MVIMMDLDGYLANTQEAVKDIRQKLLDALQTSEADEEERTEVIDGFDQLLREIQFLVSTMKYNLPKKENDSE